MVIAYACIGKEKSTLFIADSKLDKSTREGLNNNNISILPYEEIGNFILFLNKNQYTISIDREKTNYALYSLINEQFRRDEKSIVALFKAQKNETEVNNLRKALQMDGVALCRALSMIEEKITKKETLTEYEVGEIIHEERAQFPEFHCDSFAPIVGFGANGAVVHYNAKEDEAATITSDNLLLIDSGGNYLCGTTDITRTFVFGEATAQQKRDYTLVLKGHIALAQQAFPTGTCGEQLDILARHGMKISTTDMAQVMVSGISFAFTKDLNPFALKGKVLPCYRACCFPMNPDSTEQESMVSESKTWCA